MAGWDLAILVAYLVGITLLGSLLMRGQTSTRDYFVAGRGMGWLPVAISVLATNFSAITLLGSPGYIIARDTLLLTRYVGLLVLTPLTVWLFLRFYYRLNLVSIYEYIGRRFDENIRFVSAGIFVLLRTCWMATAQYATALALTRVMGLDLWTCVLVVGLMVTVYSSLGGIKADIWTDVIQAVVLLGAVLVTIAICMNRVPDGFGGIWRIAEEGGKIRFFEPSTDLTKVTSLGMLFGITFGVLASYGVDQVIVQRYFTTKNPRSLVRSAYVGMLSTIPLVLLTGFVGLSIFAYYTTFPDRLSAGSKPDVWFPSFILTELPVGVTGLIMAGIFAATMSSTDSGLNSLTAVVMTDFYRPLRRRLHRHEPDTGEDRCRRERQELRLARWLSFTFGLMATVASLFVDRIGTIAEISITLNGVIAGVLLGIFMAAILSTRTNGAGALIGAAIGTAVVLWAAFGTRINYFWYNGIGCVTTFAATYAASVFFPPPDDRRLDGLTLKRRERPIAPAEDEAGEKEKDYE